MTKKWNLQDIHPSESRKKRSENVAVEQENGDMRRTPTSTRPRREEQSAQRPASRPRKRSSGNQKGLIMKVGVGLIALVGIGFLGSMLLSGSEVTIYPKHKDVTVQANFTAYTEPAAGELGYELLTLEADGERQVTATGREDVSERAGGTLFIYNNFSENSVRLVKNTRFESSNGLVFRISESAVVPGYTKDSSGSIQPGVTTAEIFADGTGEVYNIEPDTFTIPGFEGEPEFDALYGESKERLIGGFEGERYIIEEAELESAQEAVHNELREALRARLSSEKPAGFVLYDDAVTFTFDSLPSTEGGGDLATIKERAQLQVPIFKADTFAGYIAQNTVAGYGDEPVTLVDPQSLSFMYTSTSTSENNIGSATSVTFSLAGNTEIVWSFDEEALKNALAGLSKSALPTVLGEYTAIERAEATIRPFWKQSFPSDPEGIKLNVVIEPQN